MQRVFTAATLLEAHLVQQMLEAETIPAAVFNENAHVSKGNANVFSALCVVLWRLMTPLGKYCYFVSFCTRIIP